MTALSERDHDERRIGQWDTLALGVNGVIGSGIFFLPSVGDKLLGPAALIATFVAGVLAWLIASSFGSVSAQYTRNGGAYVYTKDAFGRGPGFVVGWMTWIVAVTSWGALLNALFLALGGLWGRFEEPVVKSLGMGLLVVFLVGINIRGLKVGAGLSTLLTLLKASPLILLALVGIPSVELSHFNSFAPQGWGGFADATLLILYAYVGFESLVVPASEIRDVRSTLPSILPKLLIGVTVLYLILQIVCIGTLTDLSSRANPIADSAKYVLGDVVGMAFLWVSVVSVLGVNAGTALVTPRRLAALADEGDAPKILGHLHRRFRTPAIAIALTGAAALAFALSGSFKELALLSVVARFVQYLPTCWVAFRSMPAGKALTEVGTRIKAGLAILTSGALLVAADSEKLIAGLVGIALLSLVYVFLKKSRAYSR